MRVRLTQSKMIEVSGKMVPHKAGDELDVGKGDARKWVASGEAIPIDVVIESRASSLMKRAREFWFNNEGGTLLDGDCTRQAMYVYGGPNPEFDSCEKCQEVEWRSRLTQTPLDVGHECNTSKLCKVYCDRQGKEEWAHFHQNFLFALGVDDELDAPRCLMIQPPKGHAFLTTHSCDQSVQVFLRQFARACQYDLVKQGDVADPRKYDFVFFVNNGVPPTPPRPQGVPSIVYCHDLWKRHVDRQEMLDSWQPDVLWTPFVSSWKRKYRIPKDTEVVMRPIPASMFFTRPNLEEKEVDLLVVGAAKDGIYSPRLRLSEMLAPLAKDYRVKFHHVAGARRSRYDGPNNRAVPYGPAWSKFLGTAKFVAFGGIADNPQPAFFKHYEVLGSGAVPIFPKSPDLKGLGVFAWEHYIPVGSIGSAAEMKKYLDDYGGWKHIASNAVEWTVAHADRLLFDGFEDLVRKVTEGRYPRRLLDVG